MCCHLNCLDLHFEILRLLKESLPWTELCIDRSKWGRAPGTHVLLSVQFLLCSFREKIAKNRLAFTSLGLVPPLRNPESTTDMVTAFSKI